MSAIAASPIVAAAGGSFLLESRTPEEIFTPEDLNEEQRQIAATAARFAGEEILPVAPAIEAKEPCAMQALLRKAAELAAIRKMTLLAAGVASQRFVTGLEEQQEIMADLAGMIAHVYALESALLRAQKLAGASRNSAEVAAAMTGLLADQAMGFAEQAARRVLAACSEGDALRTQLAILRRLARFNPADVVGLSRTAARYAIALERYPV